MTGRIRTFTGIVMYLRSKFKLSGMVIRYIWFAALAALMLSCAGHEKEGVLEVYPEDAVLKVGDTLQLNYLAAPLLSGSNVRWSTSAGDVLIVDNSGKAVALSEGEAVVTAYYNGLADECRVSVRRVEVESLALSAEMLTMYPSDTIRLIATVYPSDAENASVVWKSSNQDVVQVDDSGLLLALRNGTAEIKAEAGGKECSCSVVVCTAPEAGDYFYADGTYSTELDEAKTVCGIVFWVCDPTAEDPVLKRDFPECTHGLVVSVSEAETQWQSSWEQSPCSVSDWVSANHPDLVPVGPGMPGKEDNVNRILGYNNTCALGKFNADAGNSLWKSELAEALEFHRQNYPAPENTSGWYIPSIKEMSYMCSGIDHEDLWDLGGLFRYMTYRINDRLYGVEGADLIDLDRYYWTSTEWDRTSSFDMYSYNGLAYYDKKDMKNKVRFILAF